MAFIRRRPGITTIRWWRGGGRRQPLRSYIACEHLLREMDYDSVHDSFDYRP